MRKLVGDAVVEHIMPGRLRLRFRSKRGDVEFFKFVVAQIRQHPAVEEIHANPLTGGVLVLHSMGSSEVNYLLGLGAAPQTSQQAHTTNSEGMPIDKSDLSSAGLQGLSLLQLLRGRVFGSAAEHAWQAFQAEEAKMPHVKPLLLVAALIQVARGRLLSPASSLFMYSLLSQRRVREPEQASNRSGEPYRINASANKKQAANKQIPIAE